MKTHAARLQVMGLVYSACLGISISVWCMCSKCDKRCWWKTSKRFRATEPLFVCVCYEDKGLHTGAQTGTLWAAELIWKLWWIKPRQLWATTGYRAALPALVWPRLNGFGSPVDYIWNGKCCPKILWAFWVQRQCVHLEMTWNGPHAVARFTPEL